MLTKQDKLNIVEMATEGNWPLCDLAEVYQVSEEEIEQIVLSYIYKRGE